MRVSVLDLHKLTPEQRRLNDLGTIVFHRHRLLNQDANQIYNILNESGFDYTLQEIEAVIEEMKNGR